MQNYRYGFLGFGLVLVLGGLAVYWNSLKPQAEAPQSAPSHLAAPAPQAPAEKGPKLAPTVQDVPANPEKPEASGAAAPTGPVFDILRAETDGSVVIAGQAAPNASVEVVAGSKVLGTAKAAANGDFAVVLDHALPAGDHQLVLRATGPDSKVATSAQTAIVSVPENADGQVLALVEEPGQASRLITKPEGAPAPQPGTQAPNAGEIVQPKPDPDAPIAIEAVEIEGDKVFVAGRAKDGDSVVVSANDTVLGSSPVSPEGRFLVQSQQPLAVGDYIIKADLLDKAGRVLATARVPFRREAGEKVSAVASGMAAQGQEQDADATPLQKVEGSVIIRRGDNLWTISKRTYGMGTRYTTIYLANREQIRNPDLIWPGQVFVMPKEPLADDEATRRLRDSAN